MTIAALEHGCHVVLEKPMTTSVAAADRMIAAARAADRHIFSYQPHRWAGETGALKEILDSGILGRVYSIRYGYYEYRRRNDWQSLTKNNGGMLYN